MAPMPSSRRAKIRCTDRSWSGHVVLPLDGLEAVLEPVAGAVDGDHVAVIEEPAEESSGEDLVAETWPHSLKVLFDARMIEPFS